RHSEPLICSFAAPLNAQDKDFTVALPENYPHLAFSDAKDISAAFQFADLQPCKISLIQLQKNSSNGFSFLYAQLFERFLNLVHLEAGQQFGELYAPPPDFSEINNFFPLLRALLYRSDLKNRF